MRHQSLLNHCSIHNRLRDSQHLQHELSDHDLQHVERLRAGLLNQLPGYKLRPEEKRFEGFFEVFVSCADVLMQPSHKENADPDSLYGCAVDACFIFTK